MGSWYVLVNAGVLRAAENGIGRATRMLRGAASRTRASSLPACREYATWVAPHLICWLMVEAWMRTTIAIDDDVLAAAKAIARQRKQAVGKVISELARKSLRPPSASGERNGVPLLPVRKLGLIVTPEIVNAIREEVS
jgi:hypothetical protein